VAKTIALTVQVDDTQFQKFMKDYQAFAGQVQNLNAKFNAINSSINKSKQLTIDWLGTLRTTQNALTGIVPMAEKITKNIAKWSALIGGIAMMLGTGAGLFGIERLANALIQRRRQMMGIGGDWGQIQAAQMATQATVTDPLSVMQRIRMGQMGDRLTRVGLQAAGVSLEDQKSLSASQIYEKVIRNMPDIIRSLPKGQELPALEQRFLTRIMPMEDWARFIKPGGGLDVEEHQRVLKRLEEEKKQPGLTPEAGRTWADLYEAARSFVAQIQTSLGNALSGIASSLTEVSKGFTDLVRALLDTPAVKRALEQLKTWLDSFADYLKSDEAKKKLQEWTEEMEKVPWARLGEVIGTFIENLGTVIRVLLALKGATMGAGIGAAVGGPWGGALGAIGGGLAGWFAPELLMGGISSLGGGAFAPGDPNAPANFSQRFGDWRTKNWWGGGGMVPHPSMFNQNWWMQPPTFPVNPMDPNATTPPAATGGGKQSFGGSSTNYASLTQSGGARNVAVAGRGSNMYAQGGPNMSSWRSAAKNAVPSSIGGGWSSVIASNNLNFGPGGGRAGRGRGGLDVDNWQMNRTASLRIDNVAGSNVYHTGVGLA
jgi:hypothetical protein